MCRIITLGKLQGIDVDNHVNDFLLSEILKTSVSLQESVKALHCNISSDGFLEPGSGQFYVNPNHVFHNGFRLLKELGSR